MQPLKLMLCQEDAFHFAAGNSGDWSNQPFSEKVVSSVLRCLRWWPTIMGHEANGLRSWPMIPSRWSLAHYDPKGAT